MSIGLATQHYRLASCLALAGILYGNLHDPYGLGLHKWHNTIMASVLCHNGIFGKIAFMKLTKFIALKKDALW